MQAGFLAESLFRVFDEDNSGALSFYEFAQVILMLPNCPMMMTMATVMIMMPAMTSPTITAALSASISLTRSSSSPLSLKLS